MKKFVNLRIPVLFTASLAFGILLATLLIYFGVDGIYLTIPTAIFLVVCIVYTIIKRRVSMTLVFIIAVVLFVVGAIYLYAAAGLFVDDKQFLNCAVSVNGVVREVGTTSAGNIYIIVGNANVKGTPISGNIMLYLTASGGDYCRRGYEISFYGELIKENFISDGAVNYRMVDGIRYYCNAIGTVDTTYRFSLFGEIAAAIESALTTGLDGETSAVCLAMLTGNTSGISEGTLTAFRYGGIAHVFAVSGLHIGVIYAFLKFVFKKVGLNRIAAAVIIIIVTTLYAGICNFSPSSVRAVIMCGVSAVASCIDKKYDSWNSLSVAALILLLINPLYIFDAGFVLSFGAVLGIIFLAKPLSRILFFLPSKVRGSFAVGLSAQIGTLPALLSCFGYVSTAGLLLNIIFVPIMSALYIVIFVFTVFASFLSFVAVYVLPVVCVPLELLISLVNICGFENALITAHASDWLYVPFVLIIVAVSDKFRIKPFMRAAVLLSSVLAIIFAAIDFGNTAASVTFYSGYDGGAFLISTQEGAALIITSDYRGGSYSAVGADTVVILGNDDEYAALVTNEGFDYAFIRTSSIYCGNIGDTKVTSADSFTVYGIYFEFKDESLEATLEGVTVRLARNKRGEAYAEFEEEGVLTLYLYGNYGAVLFDGELSYDLTYCGEMRYTVKDGGYRLASAVPRT